MVRSVTIFGQKTGVKIKFQSYLTLPYYSFMLMCHIKTKYLDLFCFKMHFMLLTRELNLLFFCCCWWYWYWYGYGYWFSVHRYCAVYLFSANISISFFFVCRHSHARAHLFHVFGLVWFCFWMASIKMHTWYTIELSWFEIAIGFECRKKRSGYQSHVVNSLFFHQ